MKSFEGVFTALVTPFKSAELDYESLRKLIRQQLDAGIQGFVINGTTGESPTLTNEERLAVLSFVQGEVAKQVPLVMGTGTFCTATTVELTRQAERAGAAGALVVVPYYNKPSQRGLLAHFTHVAKNTSLPILLYNVPGRTVAALSLETVVGLARLPNIIGIKEATGDLEFGRKIVDAVGPDFLVTSGDDLTFLDLMKIGGRGVISVLSHVLPKLCRQWSDAMLKGEDVRAEFEPYRRLTQLLFQDSNPVGVKTALQLLGYLRSDELRLPLVAADGELRVALQIELQNLQLIEKRVL